MTEQRRMEAVPEVASLIEQGDREYQQDAVRTSVCDDGSWLIAVADGTGGGINAEEAAPAAVAALPPRIGSDEEMIEAFAAANRAVRWLGSEESRARMSEDLQAGWARDPDTTLAVAAWTPEGGLVVGWVGDSMVMIAPSAGRGWCSRPQMMQAGAPIIGEFAAAGTASPSLRGVIARLSDDLSRSETEEMTADGAAVIVLSDGAYGSEEADEALFRYQDRWYAGHEETGEDPYADLAAMERFLPCSERRSAQRAVTSIMNRARRHGLHDNTTIAAARMPATR